jgi:hypothetical protein
LNQFSFVKIWTIASQNNNKNKKDVKGPQNETLHQNDDLNSSGKTLNNAILSSIFLTAQSAVAANNNNMCQLTHQHKTIYDVNKGCYLHR